ncbi:hypothetical protein [Allomesorhizobium alhagi]|uniref:Uncharacterized protein n=1 Tax=Mesorhizobium alhagi CCNWXJ12-2 TaxID=1107882 RepID=H0HNL9_9HYPH|nr:hypothetical protein [Mesorhizobium alhagi]EHK57672.1 hypothetical protein MAXJ12_08709 [Mesorhizobium alhagi CCNWXJ12-2]
MKKITYGGRHGGKALAAIEEAATMRERERCALVAEATAFRAEKFERERLDRPSLDFQRFREGCNAAAESIRRGDQP